MAGIKNTTGASQQQGIFATRNRPPRALGFCGEVRPFSRVHADAQTRYLQTLRAGGVKLAPLLGARFFAECPLGAGKLCVVTTSHVLFVGLASGAAGSSSSAPGSGNGGGGASSRVIWFEALVNIGTVEDVDRGAGCDLALYLRADGVRLVNCATSELRRDAKRALVEALNVYS